MSKKSKKLSKTQEDLKATLMDRISHRVKALKTSARAASLAATGSPDMIRDIARDIFPPIDKLHRLAEVLGTTIGYLIGEREGALAGEGDDIELLGSGHFLDRRIHAEAFVQLFPYIGKIRNVPPAEAAQSVLDVYDQLLEREQERVRRQREAIKVKVAGNVVELAPKRRRR